MYTIDWFLDLKKKQNSSEFWIGALLEDVVENIQVFIQSLVTGDLITWRVNNGDSIE